MISVPIGYIVIFVIILAPVYLTILASLFGKPRDFRVTGLFLGVFGGLVLAAFVGIWAFGLVLSWIMP